MATFTIVGTTDEVTVCDCCGKTMLRDTVALENAETGQVVYYGSHCAARALRMPRSKADVIVSSAKAAQKARPIIEAVRAALPAGIEAAKAAGKAAAEGVVIRGSNVLVTGFASWGCINIDWVGGRHSVGL